MMRWSILAIAFAVVACGEGERGKLSSDSLEAAAGADSALRADPGAAETRVAGGARDQGAVRADTAAPPAGADVGRTRGPTGAEAMGGTRTATTRLDLSADQVKRLQTALNDAGCNAGAVDGVVGRRTRQAIACGLEKNNLGSNDLSGLYRSLDLDF